MNWNAFKSQVTRLLKSVGFQVSVIRMVSGEEQSSMTASAVWGSNTKSNVPQGSSNISTNTKQIYIAGSLKQAPEPGDIVKQGQDLWSVVEVEAYKPTTTVLAYRVEVQ